ncbi:MAG: hypothetical protein ABH863_02710 [Candidatus Micrarchaeota archaeon]
MHRLEKTEEYGKKMMLEARRLKVEFKGYLEDLELFSKPEFWLAVREVEGRGGKKYRHLRQLRRELKLDAPVRSNKRI